MNAVTAYDRFSRFQQQHEDTTSFDATSFYRAFDQCAQQGLLIWTKLTARAQAQSSFVLPDHVSRLYGPVKLAVKVSDMEALVNGKIQLDRQPPSWLKTLARQVRE